MVADLLSCLRVRVYFAILGSSRFFLSTNAAGFAKNLPRSACHARFGRAQLRFLCCGVDGLARDFCYFRQQQVFSEHQRGKFLPRIFHAPPATQGLAVRSSDFLCCRLMASHVIFAISGSSRFFLSTNAASFCEAFSTLRLPRKVWPCAAQIFLCCRVDGLARDFLLFRAAAGYLLAPTRQVSATHLPRSACHARSCHAQLSFFVLWS